MDAADPDSSIGHHHYPGDVVAPAASPDDDAVVEMPLDDEANFRKPSPNPKVGMTVSYHEDKLEESLTVDMSDAVSVDPQEEQEELAPPPPSTPIPEDILQKHRSKAKLRKFNSYSPKEDHQDSVASASPADTPSQRRYTYHHGMKDKDSALELQQMPQRQGL